jgi:predicted O-methyltransferase YrrM
MGFRWDWFGTTAQPNFQRFLVEKHRDKEGLRYLEIGPFEGKATCWMLENVLIGNNCKITVIDTFGGGQEHDKTKLTDLLGIFLDNTKRWRNKVDTIVGKSQEILPSHINGSIPSKDVFDFVYVDGSHIGEDVFQDCDNGFRLLKEGGIMAMDDYQWPGVTGKSEDTPKPGIDKFLSMYTEKYILLMKDYQVWIEKI